MEQKEYRKLKPYHGIILFALEILATFTVIYYLQKQFGLYGVFATELVLFIMAVVAAVVLHADLKEVFRIKLPKATQVVGTILIWIGTYFAVMFFTELEMYIFPKGFVNVSNSLSGIFKSVPFIISFFIVAVSPAICEEIFHRGFILSSMKGIKNKWVVIFIVGLIFGIFHMDLIRFLPTALLGMALTYVVMETDNLACSMLMHGINNSLSIIVTFLVPQSVVAESQAQVVSMSPFAIGSSLFVSSAVPFLMLFGTKLLHYRDSTKQKNGTKGYIIAGILTVVIAVAGITVMICNLNSIIDLSLRSLK